ncbi:hypothetical protein PHSY_004685 [Pseudozyma hubeiensis SY62]|uniref:Uncharacterized protein n=1 Tax=Pseudozyma hubeiensis (strain SY62) TaxID=1305764 RepID=R9P6W3_PSEHS|nr:hypothetical protein PHSY_004685 [Pseudozyma hubeiensis SY62]GAC97101.1 hypothetical protein PHSY_004685 [Pseudozyma hubeiensis SY62]
MKPPPSASHKDMPSVVVLIPANDGDQSKRRSVSNSPSKQRQTLTYDNLRSAPPVPSSSLSSSLSSSSSSSSSTRVPSSSASNHKPSASSSSPSSIASSSRLPQASSSRLSIPTASSSSSAFEPVTAPRIKLNRPQPSSSLSNLVSSSPLSRRPSSPSSSSSSSSRALSTGSRSHSHRSRNAHHDQPVDVSDPFGDDAFMSSKRVPPSNHDLYICKWRLRDKKGVLGPVGHKYCHARLMTPTLLARHVLQQHTEPQQHSHTNDIHSKIACKWDSCFNRHYDSAGLAAHLVHDHFTRQMGLRYACIANQCSYKAPITSYDALAMHHAQYHSDVMLSSHNRKIWRPKKAEINPNLASKIFAALGKIASAPKTIPRIPVSDSANPKLPLLDQRKRTKRQIELKQKTFDPFIVQPGDGQEHEPWIHLHKRLQRRVEQEAQQQEADDAILRAAPYEEQDLAGLLSIDVDCHGDPTLRAIDEGIRSAQHYHTGSSSTLGASKHHTASSIMLPPQGYCEVLLSQNDPLDLVESIAPNSLKSIEREMRFDASLSKQLRWADQVVRGKTAQSRQAALHPAALDESSDDEEATNDWAPPLRLTPYHPSSRSRLAVTEDSSSEQTPRAIRRRRGASPTYALSSDGMSAASSRSSSPVEHAGSSSITHVYGSNLMSMDLPLNRAKREREDDGPDTTLLYGSGYRHEPPSSRVKLEDTLIDLTGSSSDEDHVAAPTQRNGVKAVFVELEANGSIEVATSLGRLCNTVKQEHRNTSVPAKERTNNDRGRFTQRMLK